MSHAIAGTNPGIIQRFEGPEHRQLGDEAVRDLQLYLATEDGAAWARQSGEDPSDLLRRMGADPHVGVIRGGRSSGAADHDDNRGLSSPGRPLASGIPVGGTRRNPAGRVIRRLELTPGEIIALMGDLYPSWQAIERADPAQLMAHVQVMRLQQAGLLDSTQASLRFERISEGRYLELAQKNRSHFATRGGAVDATAGSAARSRPTTPPPTTRRSRRPAGTPAGNRRAWRQYHEQALAMVEQSPEQLNRALLIDAAGGHFLTDAFAAGHLFDRGVVLARIANYLRDNELAAENPRQATILYALKRGPGAQLVLKNVHDHLNRQGFEIANGRGMRWRTYGDDHLHEASETQRVVALAVFLSREQIMKKARGESIDPNAVETLLPTNDTTERATEAAIQLIPRGARAVPGLLRGNLEMLKAVEVDLGVPLLDPALSWGLQFFGRPFLRQQFDPGSANQQTLDEIQRLNGRNWSTPNYLLQWRFGPSE